jgi:hypothetical protein
MTVRVRCHPGAELKLTRLGPDPAVHTSMVPREMAGSGGGHDGEASVSTGQNLWLLL